MPTTTVIVSQLMHQPVLTVGPGARGYLVPVSLIAR